MVKTMLTIIKAAPYGREDAFAGLRFSLSQIAAGMLDTCDTLLVEDGVYNAKLNQETTAIRMPSNLEATEDIMDLDGRVFVVLEDMESRPTGRCGDSGHRGHASDDGGLRCLCDLLRKELEKEVLEWICRSM